MSFLDYFFGKKTALKTVETFPWIALTKANQLNDITAQLDKIHVIFKHSTTCGISRMVIKQFENDYRNAKHIHFYMLDLWNYRELSNLVAEKFQIMHESPQIIVIKNAKVLAATSHNFINDLDLNNFN